MAETRTVETTRAVETPWRKWEALVLLAILGVGGFARVYHLTGKALWIDEFFTIQSVNGKGLGGTMLVPHNVLVTPAPQPTRMTAGAPWWRLLRPDVQDLHPPVYYVLLRGWTNLFGFTEVGLRSFSVFASLVAILALYLAARPLGGAGAALWAAAIMALAQPQIQFGQEARSYALIEAISLAGAAVLVRIESRGASWRRVIALGTIVFACLFTHYFAVSVVMTYAAYSWLRVPRGVERRRTMLACIVGVAAFAAVWGWAILEQRHGASGVGSRIFQEAWAGHYWKTLLRLVMVPVRWLNEPLPSMEAISGIVAVACVLPLMMRGARRSLLLWTMWVGLNVLPTLCVDLLNPSWSLQMARYTLLASPGLYAILGGLMAGARSPVMRHLLPATAVLSCALAAPNAYFPLYADWRKVGAAVRRFEEPGAPTVFASKEDPRIATIIYFMGAGHYAQPLPGPVLLLDGEISESVLGQLREFRRVIVVSDGQEPTEFLPGARVLNVAFFPHVGRVSVITFEPLPSEIH